MVRRTFWAFLPWSSCCCRCYLQYNCCILLCNIFVFQWSHEESKQWSTSIIFNSNLPCEILHKVKRKHNLLQQRQPHFFSFQIATPSAWNSHICDCRILICAFSVLPVRSQQITLLRTTNFGNATRAILTAFKQDWNFITCKHNK